MGRTRLQKLLFILLMVSISLPLAAQRGAAFIGATIVNPVTIQNASVTDPVNITFSAVGNTRASLKAKFTTSVIPRTGTVTAAAFIISGSETANFSVTVSSEISLLHQNHIDSLTTTRVESTTSIMKEGAGLMQTLKIDATIEVKNNTKPGMYTSTPYEVTVNYH